jgi:hypothetical protein
MNFLKKLFDLVSFVAGPMLFLVGIFSFGYSQLPWDNAIAVAYYYNGSALALISVGGGLVALGFVLRSWARGSK